MRITTAVHLVVFFVISSWGIVRADEEQGVFERLDTNQDGLVTSDEVGEEHQRLFKRLLRTSDKNDDGKLSRLEFTDGTTPQDTPQNGQPQPGQPQPGTRSPEERLDNLMRQLDKDGDGKVALSELPAERRAEFERLLQRFDDDGDKALTRQQFLDAMRTMAGRQPDPAARPQLPAPYASFNPLARALDTNQDGELSAEEIANAPLSLAKLDRDNDGSLSLRDLTFAARGSDAGPDAAPELQRLFLNLRQADANGDQKISRDEAPPRLLEQFDRLDANSDGQLDRQELGNELRRMTEILRGGGEPARKLRERLQADRPARRLQP